MSKPVRYRVKLVIDCARLPHAILCYFIEKNNTYSYYKANLLIFFIFKANFTGKYLYNMHEITIIPTIIYNHQIITINKLYPPVRYASDTCLLVCRTQSICSL